MARTQAAAAGNHAGRRRERPAEQDDVRRRVGGDGRELEPVGRVGHGSQRGEYEEETLRRAACHHGADRGLPHGQRGAAGDQRVDQHLVGGPAGRGQHVSHACRGGRHGRQAVAHEMRGRVVREGFVAQHPGTLLRRYRLAGRTRERGRERVTPDRFCLKFGDRCTQRAAQVAFERAHGGHQRLGGRGAVRRQGHDREAWGQETGDGGAEFGGLLQAHHGGWNSGLFRRHGLQHGGLRDAGVTQRENHPVDAVLQPLRHTRPVFGHRMHQQVAALQAHLAHGFQHGAQGLGDRRPVVVGCTELAVVEQHQLARPHRCRPCRQRIACDRRPGIEPRAVVLRRRAVGHLRTACVGCRHDRARKEKDGSGTGPRPVPAGRRAVAAGRAPAAPATRRFLSRCGTPACPTRWSPHNRRCVAPRACRRPAGHAAPRACGS